MWTIYLQRLSKIRTFSFGKGEKGRWGSSRLFLLFTIDLCENWPAKLPFPANDPELETSPVLVPFPKFKTLPIAQWTREFSDFAKLIAQTTSCDQIISSSTATSQCKRGSGCPERHNEQLLKLCLFVFVPHFENI